MSAADPQIATTQQHRIAEARTILAALGFPSAQQNERSALTLLALANLRPDQPWSEVATPLRGVTPLMVFFGQQYGKVYAANTRETVRRQTIHQFRDAGLILENSDKPDRPTNSGQTVYQLTPEAAALLQTFGSADWEQSLAIYLAILPGLRERYAQARAMHRVPIRFPDGTETLLSPGGQNPLLKQIVEEFAPRYTPGGRVLYLGDSATKWATYDRNRLGELGVQLDLHGKMPDVVIEYVERSWIVLIEAVTSHGPIDAKRRAELVSLFRNPSHGLVFVTAFSDRQTLKPYLGTIAWETEVWVAETPDHLIHFNGDRFLGPYPLG